MSREEMKDYPECEHLVFVTCGCCGQDICGNCGKQKWRVNRGSEEE